MFTGATGHWKRRSVFSRIRDYSFPLLTFYGKPSSNCAAVADFGVSSNPLLFIWEAYWSPLKHFFAKTHERSPLYTGIDLTIASSIQDMSRRSHCSA